MFRPSQITFKSLLSSIHFNFTAKSRRQTTPNLFQNPKLTKHGLIQKIPRSYDYNLPQDLPNRHLYWDRSVQNKARRVKYNSHRLEKLKIKPIHIQGKRTFERTLPEILNELSNTRLVKASLHRTFANVSQALNRFKSQMSPEDMAIVKTTIDDIHQRFLPSLNLYHFSTYIQIRCIAQIQCTQEIFVHLYKFIQKFSEMSQSQHNPTVKKFKLKIFLKILRYVFGNKKATYLEKNRQMLWKNRQMFKLFEDNDARFISFEELMPYIYSKQEVADELNDEQVKKNLKYIRLVPGGDQLLHNLGI